MRWLLPVILLLAVGATHGSDAIPGKAQLAVEAPKQPHVIAELIPETNLVSGGGKIDVILHLRMDEGWHTYWINPGDAGLATSIKWTLPSGWSASAIQWPTPEVHAMGPLTTYGYGGDVYLLITLQAPPKDGGAISAATLHARASWLVCQEECIPGKADFDLKLDFVGPATPMSVQVADNKEFFDEARARLPVANTNFHIKAWYGEEMDFNSLNGPPSLNFDLLRDSPSLSAKPSTVRFIAEQPNVLGNDEKSQGGVFLDESGKIMDLWVRLLQNGQKPDHLSGVLVSDQPLQGESKAIYLASFPVSSEPSAASETTPSKAVGETRVVGPAATTLRPTLLAILGAAFIGGLILNLMPCVLPVLSLKVFSLIKHAESGSAWRQGLAFTAGVLVSFWVLAGLLIALQSAGHHLGWGFQMQSPGFVLALTFLFFLLGLNLFGVFELGTSLSGLDAKATSHLGGQASSFANGALATLAATPCTAPFMGSAVGFAAQQPAFISLLVFTVLALGMAAPYLALTIFPGALRLVPKPGAWMETLKQFMGFLLMGTVIFLVYVFAAETGQESVPLLLGTLLVVALAAWIYGRASSPLHEPATRIGWMLVVLALMAGAIGEGVRLTHHKAPPSVAVGDWQPWSPDAVRNTLAKGQPVFVDFTAAWCVSCKANEEVALDIDSTKKLFAAKHVALFRGDWTNEDPKIYDVLRQYNRNGVPLYLVYSPKEPDAPQVLPEVLTPGIVRDALQKLP